MQADGYQVLTETTSKAQDDKMTAKAEDLMANEDKAKYNAMTNNCDQFVQKVLAVADPQAALNLGLDPTNDFILMLIGSGGFGDEVGFPNGMHSP